MKWVWGILMMLSPWVAHAACDPFAQTGDRPGLCTVSRSLDGMQTTCHWPFAFREQGANDFAAMIKDHLLACGADELPPEAGVNHPDTYGQTLFILPQKRVSVSIKDKTALSRTLVFLSVTDLR